MLVVIRDSGRNEPDRQRPVIVDDAIMRLIGDSIFIVGAFSKGWFVVGLFTGWSRVSSRTVGDEYHVDSQAA